MIKYEGKKLTPNQLGKVVVFEMGNARIDYWQELFEFEETANAMTDREKEETSRAIDKQLDRVRKFLSL